MAIRSFWFTDTVSVSANATGTLQFRVGAGETARFKRLVSRSTGAYNITNIRDTTSRQYSDASSTDPIPSVMLALGQTAGNPVQFFTPPLEVVGDLSLLIDVIDTSGSTNTITLVIEGEKETAGE